MVAYALGVHAVDNGGMGLTVGVRTLELILAEHIGDNCAGGGRDAVVGWQKMRDGKIAQARSAFDGKVFAAKKLADNQGDTGSVPERRGVNYLAAHLYANFDSRSHRISAIRLAAAMSGPSVSKFSTPRAPTQIDKA
ncbi:MAG TPA: hypothetical protein VEU54_04780 [Steroidobacteraceae bacterium]|jgi:hypothetical protein|nr:hypothetical protein [Steroidobacteraceae bacterium]